MKPLPWRGIRRGVRRMPWRRTAAIVAALAAIAAAPPPASPAVVAGSAAVPACDRACLRALIDRYLDALGRRDPTSLPLATGMRFTENGALLFPGEGVWRTSTPGATPYLYVLDPEGRQAAVQAVIREGDERAFLQVRLRIDDAGRIVEVETIVCRKGGTPLFAPDAITHPPAAFAAAVPAGQRNSRGELIAAANAYFEAVETEGTPVYQPASFAPGANRIENGVQTTNAPLHGGPPSSAEQQLDEARFAGTVVGDRRYPVVDVENGVVLGIVMYRRPLPQTSDSAVQKGQAARGQLLLGEAFKVSGGRIREIRAVMVDRPRGAPSGW